MQPIKEFHRKERNHALSFEITCCKQQSVCFSFFPLFVCRLRTHWSSWNKTCTFYSFSNPCFLLFGCSSRFVRLHHVCLSPFRSFFPCWYAKTHLETTKYGEFLHCFERLYPWGWSSSSLSWSKKNQTGNEPMRFEISVRNESSISIVRKEFKRKREEKRNWWPPFYMQKSYQVCFMVISNTSLVNYCLWLHKWSVSGKKLIERFSHKLGSL